VKLTLPWLGRPTDSPFPDPALALAEPNGLLALGGGLEPERLLRAYRMGIFPWYAPGEPILWWSPDPRCVFATGRMHRARRLRRWLQGCAWTVDADRRFDAVIDGCAMPRTDEAGTWITPEMRGAYLGLHRLGHAHSVEVMDGDRLLGGLYGVAIGCMFFAESMFSVDTNASKVALLALAMRLNAWGFPWIDAQVANPHLDTLGATRLSRAGFLAEVASLTRQPFASGDWRERFGAVQASTLAG
jgi:leucyl/phenylalanyl-tRNA--protein transferase